MVGLRGVGAHYLINSFHAKRKDHGRPYIHKTYGAPRIVVTILPPDLTTAFLVALIVPLIIGFIVGLIIRSLLKIGIAIAVLIIILILLGILTPSQVLTPLISLVKSGASSSTLANEAKRFAGYLPYSSITFIVGLIIGLLKG